MGEIHFSCEVDSYNQSLIVDIAFGNNETQMKVFKKENFPLVKIGRNADNEIVLENYAYSRRHTSFFYSSSDESWYIQDGFENKPSTNGSWYIINNVRIYLDGPWPIETTMNFRIGSHFLQVRKIK